LCLSIFILIGVSIDYCSNHFGKEITILGLSLLSIGIVSGIISYYEYEQTKNTKRNSKVS